jgi:hypothetical protein
MGEPILSPLRQNWGNRSCLRRAEQPYDPTKSREENRGPEGDASACPSRPPRQRRRRSPAHSKSAKPQFELGNPRAELAAVVGLCDQSESRRARTVGIGMRRIRIGTDEIAIDAADIQERLAKAHASHERPLCLCRAPGVAMYVAKIAEWSILKRMPETGPDHDPSCDSYEAPYELSGFGHVSGSAIRENIEDGVTLLKLDFGLSKTGAKSLPVPKEAVRAAASRPTVQSSRSDRCCTISGTRPSSTAGDPAWPASETGR